MSLFCTKIHSPNVSRRNFQQIKLNCMTLSNSDNLLVMQIKFSSSIFLLCSNFDSVSSFFGLKYVFEWEILQSFGEICGYLWNCVEIEDSCFKQIILSFNFPSIKGHSFKYFTASITVAKHEQANILSLIRASNIPS